METLSVRCNHCGAPLQVGEKTRFVTCQFCQAQLEVKHTSTAAFTEVIDKIAENTAQMADNLKVIELQNEIERLDREWRWQKDSHSSTGRYGGRRRPSIFPGITGAVIVLPLAVFWTYTSIHTGAPRIFPLFGVCFICAALYNVVSNIAQSGRLGRLEADYQRQRSDLLNRLEKARAGRD